ncbi:transposase [Burkholderia cepacia]|uniref:transposase n=1 Tax=Burkholderia cepacia TaxID=292 RepID=UPI001F1CA0B2|nr:transposase [Burkholderia cepacia]MCE4124385.1 transposase [Burkholderia cepacia]
MGAAYLLKVLVHDGIGIWPAVRRLSQVQSAWPHARSEPKRHVLRQEQLAGLVVGWPWQCIGADGTKLGFSKASRKDTQVFRSAANHGSQIVGDALPFVAVLYDLEHDDALGWTLKMPGALAALLNRRLTNLLRQVCWPLTFLVSDDAVASAFSRQGHDTYVRYFSQLRGSPAHSDEEKLDFLGGDRCSYWVYVS